MTIAAEAATAEPATAATLARWLRPALGLLLPVGLARGWELVVRDGLGDRAGWCRRRR